MLTKRSGRSSETRSAKKRHSGKKKETSGRNHRVVDREPESAGRARTVAAAVVVVVAAVEVVVAVAVAVAEAIADHRLRDHFRLRPLPTAVAPRDHRHRTAVVPLREGRRSAAQGKILIGIAAGMETGNNPNEKESREAAAAVVATAEV